MRSAVEWSRKARYVLFVMARRESWAGAAGQWAAGRRRTAAVVRGRSAHTTRSSGGERGGEVKREQSRSRSRRSSHSESGRSDYYGRDDEGGRRRMLRGLTGAHSKLRTNKLALTLAAIRHKRNGQFRFLRGLGRAAGPRHGTEELLLWFLDCSCYRCSNHCWRHC
jgi:hypothetical protein